MSGEIEFLGPEPEPQPEEPAPARSRKRPAGWIAAIGWTAATTLAVIAPFQRLYGNGGGLPRRYADYLPGSAGSSNGWGNGGVLGPRFGVALVACAAVCAVLAVTAWIRVLSGRSAIRPHRTLAAASVAAPSLLAGVVGMLALFLRFESNPALGWTSYGPGLQFVSPEAYSSHVTIAFAATRSQSHSWCLWLAVAAMVCAIVAAVAQSVANRTAGDLAG